MLAADHVVAPVQDANGKRTGGGYATPPPCAYKRPRAFTIVTKDSVVETLNMRVCMVKTTKRGGNRRTSNVVLSLRWASVDDEVVLVGYEMYGPEGGPTYVSGALFTTDEMRSSCLPFMSPRDLVDIVARRMTDLDVLKELWRYIVIEVSSDGTIIQNVSIPITSMKG